MNYLILFLLLYYLLLLVIKLQFYINYTLYNLYCKADMNENGIKVELNGKQSQQIQAELIQTNILTKDQPIPAKIQPSTYMELFHFADKQDWILMAFAILFSLGNGVSIVFYSIPLKKLINAFSATQTKDQIVAATLQSVYGFFFNSILVFVNCWLMTAAWTITSERQMSRARKEYFQALLRQQISWHDQHKPAEVCSKMYVQIAKVQQGLVTNMTSVLNKISMGVSGIIVALTVGYQMALVMIGFLPVMMASGMIKGYFTKQKDMYLQTKKVKIDSDVMEVFDNIKTVKMLGGQYYETHRFQNQVEYQRRINWSHGWKGSLAFTFFFFCIIANYALGFWYGTKLVSENTINKNTGHPYNLSEVIVIFFTLYISNLNLTGLPESLASFAVCRYSMKNILNIVMRTPNIKDGHTNLPKNIKSILFKNIHFKYDKPLFDNLNLKIQKGTTVLIGQSGCGKSTIVSLLMRFYDTINGAIQFQSEDKNICINQIKNQNLRKRVGYVGQEPILIGKTIRQALMAENYSDNEVYSVLQKVKADSFVRSIGLFSEFKSVSGGQKQRLAIARALLKKPSVLILDESTSALDQKTERHVLDGILKSGVDFVIMIAHRQQTLKYANKIIKVTKGQIQFEGSYEDLLNKGRISIQNLQKLDEEAEQIQRQRESETEKKLKQIKSKLQEQLQPEEDKSIIKIEQTKYRHLEFKMKYIWELMKLNKELWVLYVMGIMGAIYFGCIFPSFSYLISRIIMIMQNISIADEQSLPVYQEQAYWMSTTLFLISFGSLIFTTLRLLSFQYINEAIGYKVKTKAFQKLINRKYATIEQDDPHSYAYMIIKNCQDLKALAGNFMPAVIENAITLTVGLGIAFVYSWQITSISLLILPLILLSSKMMMSFNQGMQSNTDEMHKRNHELVITSIMHLRTVKSCYLEGPICGKYARQLQSVLKHSIKYSNLSGILFGVGQTLISCTFGVIFFIGAVLIQKDMINTQDLYTAIFAVMFAGVQAGGNLFFLGQLPASKLGATIFYEKIQKPSNQSESQSFVGDQTSDNQNPQSNTGAQLSIENVCFGYENRGTSIFDNFTLRVKRNEKVAIVGQSGSGKSTLAGLIFKLYQVKQGKITIDGQQISQIPKNKRTKMLGIVMQQPALFNRSVYENLKYNSDLSFDQIKQACKQANAYDFIVESNFGINQEKNEDYCSSTFHNIQIPIGFDKCVGPRGSYLSGGQKQRLSIARALARRPKILILDEATSALDPSNEKKIQQTMQNIKNTTQIIIAHRLSTIISCDRIIVLRNGCVVQQGKYADLVKKGGYFSELISASDTIQK